MGVAKVLHVIQRFGVPTLTGSEKAIELLCQSLAKSGQVEFKIGVVTSTALTGAGFYDPRERQLAPGQSVKDQIQLIRLRCSCYMASLYFIFVRLLPLFANLGGGWLKLAAFGPQLRGLSQVIDQEKPAIIHASPMPMSHVLSCWKLARAKRIPLIVTPTMHFEQPEFNLPIVDQILKDSSAVIAHTQFEKNELIKRGIEASKIEVIHSSFLAEDDFILADDREFRLKHNLKDDPYVAFIGSKSIAKGTLTLLEAWPIVLRAYPNTQLVIAGLSTKSWESGKKNLPMERVVELDYIDDQQKRAILSGCSLLAVPSSAESFGMIILEAWAKSKPVIGGSAGATRELIAEGKDGFTVEFGSPIELAQRIIELLSNQKLAQSLGRSGQLKAKQFNESELVSKTLAIYRKVLTESN